MPPSALLSVFFLFSFVFSVSASVDGHVSGVVEGYYWSSDDAVRGVYGSYTPAQRDSLLRFIAKNNNASALSSSFAAQNVYYYAPQPPADTVAPWSPSTAASWAQTAALASSVSVSIVYGIRPGYLEADGSTAAMVTAKVKELAAAGIPYFALNFDDAPGGASSAQQKKQAALVNTLIAMYSPTVKCFSVTPGYYYGQSVPSTTTWAKSLASLDNALDLSVAFVLAGKTITPSSMSPNQFPVLPSRRRLVFWDNWAAVDTSSRIPWSLPPGRDRSLFSSPSYGYVLNLPFPPERTIHEIFAASMSASAGLAGGAAQAWSGYLVDEKFIDNASRGAVATALQTAIVQDNWYDSISQLVSAYPVLDGIFE